MAISKTVLGLVTTTLLTTAACTGGFSLGGNAGAGASTTGGGGQVAAGGEDPGSSYGGPSGEMAGNGGPAADQGPAEPRWDDFAFAVRERTGSYWGTWTITKLTTFKVGATCYSKMGEKDSYSLNTVGYYNRGVHELAKKWTGEDWDRVESQRSDRKKDRSLVEPMMDEFGSRYHLTIAVEGDDCETTSDALWIRYWYDVGEAIADYPSLSGKMFITLNVSASARDVTSTVSEDGTTFEFTLPRDIEAKGWQEKVEKPFRKNAAQI
jgi:hypothetical protein